MRSQTLDILRAIAVLLVLGRHMEACPVATNQWLHVVTSVWKNGGGVGVDLFFTLSGFLIAGLLFREHQNFGHISLKNFLIRRGLKIYPPFYALLLVTLLVLVFTERSVPWREMAVEAVFMQNYFSNFWDHSWSLAVEEHFYIVLPLLLVLLVRFRSRIGPDVFRVLPLMLICVAAFCLFLRVMTVLHCPSVYQRYFVQTHLRIDALLAGVVVSYFYHYRRPVMEQFSARWRGWLVAGGILCFVPAFCLEFNRSVFLPTIGISLRYLHGAMLLVALVPVEARLGRVGRMLSYCGTYSYSIYLWHIPMALTGTVMVEFLLRGQLDWYGRTAVYFFGSLAVGLLMAKLVENPVIRVRDRFFPSRSIHRPGTTGSSREVVLVPGLTGHLTQ